MLKGKLVKVKDSWILQLPIEAAIALGAKEGDEIKISVTKDGLSASSATSNASDKEFFQAAANVFSENSGVLKKLAKR